jgi:hypothetical protein
MVYKYPLGLQPLPLCRGRAKNAPLLFKEGAGVVNRLVFFIPLSLIGERGKRIEVNSESIFLVSMA